MVVLLWGSKPHCCVKWFSFKLYPSYTPLSVSTWAKSSFRCYSLFIDIDSSWSDASNLNSFQRISSCFHSNIPSFRLKIDGIQMQKIYFSLISRYLCLLLKVLEHNVTTKSYKILRHYWLLAAQFLVGGVLILMHELQSFRQ